MDRDSVELVSEDDESDNVEYPEVYIQPELVEMVHNNRRGSGSRSETLELWNYNWQTKEKKRPNAIVVAGKAIDDINESFDIMKNFCHLLSTVPEELKPDELLQTEKTVSASLRMKGTILQKLETKVNAMKLFWFPETERQFELGGYKVVRQPVQELKLAKHEVDNLACAVCQENQKTFVTFTRRCTLNPLLKLRCDQDECTCKQPNICLSCALHHLLKNCIHVGKSSVRCPSCRGEFCIYDIQEVNIVSVMDKEDLEAEMEKLKEEKAALKKERENIELLRKYAK